MDIKRQCGECENTEFFKEDGYYFCSACHTKIEVQFPGKYATVSFVYFFNEKYCLDVSLSKILNA